MPNSDIEQRFHLIQKEIEATAALLNEAKIDLTATVDSLRIEIEVMKMLMERYHHDFSQCYPRFRDEAMQVIDPEWIGSRPAGKS
jgi:hypothetical protein